MKKAGIREARQNLSALLDEVRKGHEITITDRGRPVARLVPPQPATSEPFRGRAAFRRKMPKLNVPLSASILSDREERG
jgi:prevent-host-death family protein